MRVLAFAAVAAASLFFAAPALAGQCDGAINTQRCVTAVLQCDGTTAQISVGGVYLFDVVQNNVDARWYVAGANVRNITSRTTQALLVNAIASAMGAFTVENFQQSCGGLVANGRRR